MNPRLLFLLAAFSLSANAQPWSTFLNPSRAIDWTSAGFTIPNYTANCSTQPSLQTGSSHASANTTAINNALASCDSSHNVVHIPAGTYYVAGISFPDHGHQVLRGAGAIQTTLVITDTPSCNGDGGAICMSSSSAIYAGNDAVMPPSGTQQCSWTGTNGVVGTYTQGATSIILNSCGGTPPLNGIIILDQANDTSDNSGVYICDNNVSACTYNGGGGGNNNGRFIGGKTHSQQQVTYVTAVSGSGSGPYTVTISPGVYFTNIRSSQSPGAWWSAFAANDGIENLKIDNTSNPGGYGIDMYSCYQCWVTGVASIKAPRGHVHIYLSANDVVRNNYFYQAQTSGSDSYGVESSSSSAFLVENNVFQQTTAPIMFGAGTGTVIGYNFTIDNQFGNQYLNPMFDGHNAGNEMNLYEGNSTQGIWTDNGWGSSNQQTHFRNMEIGWAIDRINSTFPVMHRALTRNFNFVGNVLGQPGYHTNYQSYATSRLGGVNASLENTSIYSLGWGGTDANCTQDPGIGSTACDPLTYSTSMRWGNYDVVTNGVKWDATEASPGAVPYVNSNFTSSYFSSLAHTLPASLYYSSKPSWWPSSVAWPPIGPDVTGGNLGICSGTYAGAQATASGQCTGGSLSSAWAGHANSIPAQDCYLNVMHGPPDGTGGVLNFDANTCYASSSTPAVSPTSLGPWTTTQVVSQTLTANFTGTVTWSKLSGTQPAGLSGTCITGTTGTSCTLTGTLSAAGSFSFTIRATNGANTVDTPFSITVNAMPSITSSGPLPAGTSGQAYSHALSTSGGTAPLNCSLTTGSLPSGLSLSSCTISGTPSAIGTSTFTTIATDANGIVSSASASLSIAVTAPAGITLLSTTYCQPGISWSSTSPYTACNLTTAAPAGSTIIVGFATYNNAGTSSSMSGVTDTNGDTFLQVPNARSTSTQTGSGYWNDFWYAPNLPAQVISVSPKPSLTVSGNLFIWVVANVNSANAAGAKSATTSTSSSPAGAPVTTTAPATFITALLHPAPGGDPTGVNSPFISDSVTDGMGWAHLITSSTGTYTPQWNQTTATTYAGSTVAFYSSPQTGPASPTGLTATVH